MATIPELAGLVGAGTRATVPRYYSGLILQPNYDGTYHVWVRELNIVFPRIARANPDRRVLSARKFVTIVQLGVLLQIV